MSESTHLPPKAKIIPFECSVHQHQLVDCYKWLQNKQDPDVKAYLDAENAYAAAVLQPLEALPEHTFQPLCSFHFLHPGL
jgi:oligopeptidase B